MPRFKTHIIRGIAVAALAGFAGTGCDSSPSGPADGGAPYSEIRTLVGTGISGLGPEGLAPEMTELYLPQDVTYGPDNRLYILDWNNHRVRVVDGGVVRTLIGTGELGDALEGVALQVGLNHPTNISFDPRGRLIMAAWHNSKVMRYDFGTRSLERIVGTGARSFLGDGGLATDAALDLPSSTAFDRAGRMFISDQANQRIRMVDLNGIITTIAGNGKPGFAGEEEPAYMAQLFSPTGQSAPPTSKITSDADGNIFIADTMNNRIRRIDAVTGIISTVAGFTERDPDLQGGDIEIESHILNSRGVGFEGDGVPATEAILGWPCDVAVGAEGRLFIADTFNHCVRMVDLDGIIRTLVGQCGEIGYGGDGGHPLEALLNRPYGLDVDRRGNLYIADTHNNRIRVVRK